MMGHCKSVKIVDNHPGERASVFLCGNTSFEVGAKSSEGGAEDEHFDISAVIDSLGQGSTGKNSLDVGTFGKVQISILFKKYKVSWLRSTSCATQR